MDSAAYIFDLLRVGNEIQINDRRTDQTIYTIKSASGGGFCTSKMTSIHRASVNEKGALPDAFAVFQGKVVEIAESSARPAKRYKRSEFLRKADGAGFFVSANIFEANGKLYELRKAGKSRELFSVGSPTPLASFRPHSNFSHSLGSIRVYKEAVSEGEETVEHALMRDGKPTWLLDIAVLAQKCLEG